MSSTGAKWSDLRGFGSTFGNLSFEESMNDVSVPPLKSKVKERDDWKSWMLVACGG